MSDQSTALVPAREQTVDFYGDQVVAGELADGTIMVPLRPIVQALGLDWPSQTQRLRRDPTLAAGQGVVIITTPGGRQLMTALPLRLLPGWLFKLDVKRVKPELQEKILRYQAEAYEALWTAFKGQVVPGAPATPPASGAALALELAEAVASLARQQLDFEQRYTTMATYTRGFIEHTRRREHQVDGQLADHDQRLSALELQLSAGATVSEAQAAEIALAVKNVGQRLTAAGDRAGYQKVYGELYRRYGLSSYKHLPAAKYEEVLAWLRAWYGELDGPTNA